MSDQSGPVFGKVELPNAQATERGDVSAREASLNDFPKELQGMGRVVEKYSQKAFLQGYQDAFR